MLLCRLKTRYSEVVIVVFAYGYGALLVALSGAV